MWDTKILYFIGMFTRLYKSFEIKRALECYDNVKSYRKASIITGIGKSTIHRWYNTFHFLMVRQPIQTKKRHIQNLKTLIDKVY